MSEAKGRGAAPRDHKIFAPNTWDALSQATADLGWLLEKGYSEQAALKLVGDHFQLHARQRLATLRCAAGANQIAQRQARCLQNLEGAVLDIDGFNLMIALESALGGGLLLWAADGCMRDLASIHGTYRLVEQTPHALELLGKWCLQQGVREVRWWLDAPVSNSGRLCQLIREVAESNGWLWEAQTIQSVDQHLIQSSATVVSTDKIILENCQSWTNLACDLILAWIPDAWILALPARK